MRASAHPVQLMSGRAHPSLSTPGQSLGDSERNLHRWFLTLTLQKKSPKATAAGSFRNQVLQRKKNLLFTFFFNKNSFISTMELSCLINSFRDLILDVCVCVCV